MSVLPSLMLIAGDEQSDGEGEKNFHGGVHAMKRKRRDRRTHIGCLRLPSKNAARSRLFGACSAGGLGHEILKLRCDRSLTRKLLLSLPDHTRRRAKSMKLHALGNGHPAGPVLCCLMQKAARDTPLIPFREFAKQVPRILSVSKQESDRQLAEFQTENARRRSAKKNGKTHD